MACRSTHTHRLAHLPQLATQQHTRHTAQFYACQWQQKSAQAVAEFPAGCALCHVAVAVARCCNTLPHVCCMETFY